MPLKLCVGGPFCHSSFMRSYFDFENRGKSGSIGIKNVSVENLRSEGREKIGMFFENNPVTLNNIPKTGHGMSYNELVKNKREACYECI